MDRSTPDAMQELSNNITQKLRSICEQYESLSRDLESPEVLADHRKVRSISIKRAAIEPLVQDHLAYCDVHKQIDEMQAVIADQDDAELVRLAKDELPSLTSTASSLVENIQKRLVTAEDEAISSIIMEIRAGVGGSEAAIWAGDLLGMYERFASEKGWTVEIMQASPGDMGGVKQAIVSIAGDSVWAQLGYEGGTHQVKRVPATEAQGRVHTSTATVAVLAEPEQVQVELDPNDVKESITTAQGPGGQNVNKVATAVHLIHLPTGIEVRMQETKSQTQNREKAWQLLRARLFERQKAEAESQRAEMRNSMIGTGGRAEKIRTYRYKENIVVDHRIGESFNLSEIIAGNLQPLIDQLVEHDTAQRLAAL